jgi:putative ABC transport system ATP-binding protein
MDTLAPPPDASHLSAAQRPSVRISGLKVTREDASTGRVFEFRLPELTIMPGQPIGIVGASGTGKTTFLELLGLLSWPDLLDDFRLRAEAQGDELDLTQILLHRQADVAAKHRARLIGFVLQKGGLLPYLTVRENAHLAVQLSGAPMAEGTARIAMLADVMGIAPLLDRKPRSLSGGEAQRAGVLRALAPGVPFLIADEPTAALDPETARAVLTAVMTCVERERATLVVASHDAPLLREFGFRILRVRNDRDDKLRRAYLVPEAA